MIRSVVLSILFASSIAMADAGAASPAEQLKAMAPNADPAVLSLAVEAAACAAGCGEGRVERLTVIDYSKPSTEPRLWVFDLERHTLLFEELVAHGKNSGDNMAVSFSNEAGSKKSCLGLFRTGGAYTGGNGYTLRLFGLEPGINNNAYDRAIVIHGAPYVSPASIRTLGRLGRSWGCPVVRRDVAHPLIDSIKEGQLVFIYYPDDGWLNTSAYLNCYEHGHR
jgi:hypothetical protein